MGSVGSGTSNAGSATTSTFTFRELPEGRSREDKRARATRITQDFYAIAEREVHMKTI